MMKIREHWTWLRSSAVLIGVVLGGCSQAAPNPPVAAPAPAAAPWSGATLSRSDVPAVYVQQWNAAANRTRCALFAFARLGDGAGATPRAATFAGGWAVAYDQPQLRSAFGIAGTGAALADATYAGWPFQLRWADGSRADYGPEGGSGPNQLAYLQIAGQDCLYNVWSRISREHLEYLLDAIRRVNLSDAPNH